MIIGLRHFLLLAAWGILFAHSVVPHGHKGSAEFERWEHNHEHDEGLLDILSHIFHFNTGEDHLEDYSKTSDLPYFAILSTGFDAPKQVFLLESATKDVLNFVIHAPPLIRGLRAPPIRG